MSRVEIKRGNRYYCELDETTKHLAGTFKIDEQDIRVSFVRFDKFLHEKFDEVIHLRTEENACVSMFKLVRAGWSQHGGMPHTVYTQDVIANMAVVGIDKWTVADRVQKISFRIPDLDSIFRMSPHFNNVLGSDMFEMPELAAFNAETEGISVRAWLCPSGRLGESRARDATPWIDVEFAEARDLEESRAVIDSIVRFFSILCGAFLIATEIHICRYSSADIRKRAQSREWSPEHRVYYLGESEKTGDGRIKQHGSLLQLQCDDDRFALEASLCAWIERDSLWSAAAAMMMVCLKESEVMSTSRLMASTKCLEEIPIAAPLQVITPNHAKALGNLVERAGSKLGYKAIGGRFKNAISKISLESNRTRFERLLIDIRKVIGSDILDAYIVDWLVNGMTIRGTAAHRARTELDDNHELFWRAVEAIELFDLLLIVKDLPLGSEAFARARNHALIEPYRASSMLGSPRDVRQRKATKETLP